MLTKEADFAKNLNTARKLGAVLMTGSIGLTLSGMAIKSLIDKINNDVTRKHLIEDLSLNDPILKDVDKKTLMEWYATIYHYAPRLSCDKHTVMEVLRGFKRFGKVDLQTLKLLADTEKSIADAGKGTSVSTDTLAKLYSPNVSY